MTSEERYEIAIAGAITPLRASICDALNKGKIITKKLALELNNSRVNVHHQIMVLKQRDLVEKIGVGTWRWKP